MSALVDRHLQALRDLLVADVEESVAQAQARADEAAARGDEWFRQWHQHEVDWLKAQRPFAWEREEQS